MKAACLGCTLVVLSLGSASACKSRPAPAPARPSTAQLSATTTVQIFAKGVTVGRIEGQGNTWLLSGDGLEGLTCQDHDAKKSFCRSASGAAIAEVKFHEEAAAGESAIKLLSSDGKLQWKLHVGPEKIKISNNEENRDAWTLSLKHEGKIKVKDPKDQEVGFFHRSEGGGGKVQSANGETLFTIAGGGKSAFPGLLLVPGLLPRDRLILAAGLLAHGL
jgi:hypothetical protein